MPASLTSPPSSPPTTQPHHSPTRKACKDLRRKQRTRTSLRPPGGATTPARVLPGRLSHLLASAQRRALDRRFICFEAECSARAALVDADLKPVRPLPDA